MEKVEVFDDGFEEKEALNTNISVSKVQGGARRRSKKQYTYKDCSCVEKASRERKTSLSRHWIQKDILSEFKHPPAEATIDETYE